MFIDVFQVHYYTFELLAQRAVSLVSTNMYILYLLQFAVAGYRTQVDLFMYYLPISVHIYIVLIAECFGPIFNFKVFQIIVHVLK